MPQWPKFGSSNAPLRCSCAHSPRKVHAPPQLPPAGPGWEDILRSQHSVDHKLQLGGVFHPATQGGRRRLASYFFLLFVCSVHHSEKSVFVLPPKYWPHFNIRAEFHDHQGGVFIWSCCFSVISLDSFFMLLVCFSLIFWIFLNPKFICFDFESVEKYARPHFLKLW